MLIFVVCLIVIYAAKKFKSSHSQLLLPPQVQVGWKYQDIVAALEAKRKVKGEAFHKGKLEVAKAKVAVLKDPKIAKRIAPHQKVIESFGYQ